MEVGSFSWKHPSQGLHEETFKKNTAFAKDLDENADTTNRLHISVDANAKTELDLFIFFYFIFFITLDRSSQYRSKHRNS